MSIFEEFKQFALRGNVVDMAVGIILGAAFSKIVTSFVNDILMPPIGMLLGNTNFEDLKIRLSGTELGSPPVFLMYGSFINTVINFLIVAMAIFFAVKIMNRLRHQEETPEVQSKKCPECLLEVPLLAKRCGHCTREVPQA